MKNASSILPLARLQDLRSEMKFVHCLFKSLDQVFLNGVAGLCFTLFGVRRAIAGCVRVPYRGMTEARPIFYLE